jgi:hypothetical protein
MIQIQHPAGGTLSKELAATTIQEFRQSGLTQVKFCQERQIPLWRLHRWLRLDRQSKGGEKSSASFPDLIRLAIPENHEAGGSDWAYELDWKNGSLRFGRQFEASQLRQIVELLRTC